MRITVAMVLFFLSATAPADEPDCHEHSGGNFCSYSGLVKRIYVSNNHSILMYFDTPLDLHVAQGVGFNPAVASAAIIKVDDHPDFAKLFYSTALAAQASGREVTIQMRGVASGYLVIDRIWLDSLSIWE